jgi:hypothetical protein
MKSRSYGDLMVGVVAYLSLSLLLAITANAPRRAHLPDRRWQLPLKQRRRRRRVAEDACRHCKGTGHCDACAPTTCRVCRGVGLQPRDTSLVDRLNALWDGVS